jgi:hypothetical protein
VAVNLVFDDDRLMFLISVNSYHGTQSVIRRGRKYRTKADGRTRTTTINKFGCPRLGTLWRWRWISARSRLRAVQVWMVGRL